MLSLESLAAERQASRKFGYSPRREDVWHLLDTVDAHRLVVDRLTDRWVPNHRRGDPLGSWWHPSTWRVEPMSQAEQRVVHDRVVDSSAPEWPKDDPRRLVTWVLQQIDVEPDEIVFLDRRGRIEGKVTFPAAPDRVQWPRSGQEEIPYYRRVIEFVFQREAP